MPVKNICLPSFQLVIASLLVHIVYIIFNQVKLIRLHPPPLKSSFLLHSSGCVLIYAYANEVPPLKSRFQLYSSSCVLIYMHMLMRFHPLKSRFQLYSSGCVLIYSYANEAHPFKSSFQLYSSGCVFYLFFIFFGCVLIYAYANEAPPTQVKPPTL